jgi:hypothetical protein
MGNCVQIFDFLGKRHFFPIFQILKINIKRTPIPDIPFDRAEKDL